MSWFNITILGLIFISVALIIWVVVRTIKNIDKENLEKIADTNQSKPGFWQRVKNILISGIELLLVKIRKAITGLHRHIIWSKRKNADYALKAQEELLIDEESEEIEEIKEELQERAEKEIEPTEDREKNNVLTKRQLTDKARSEETINQERHVKNNPSSEMPVIESEKIKSFFSESSEKQQSFSEEAFSVNDLSLADEADEPKNMEKWKKKAIKIKRSLVGLGEKITKFFKGLSKKGKKKRQKISIENEDGREREERTISSDKQQDNFFGIGSDSYLTTKKTTKVIEAFRHERSSGSTDSLIDVKDFPEAEIESEPTVKEKSRKQNKAAVKQNIKEKEKRLLLKIENNPKNLGYYIELGDLYLFTGQFKDAEEVFGYVKTVAEPNTPIMRLAAKKLRLLKASQDK